MQFKALADRLLPRMERLMKRRRPDFIIGEPTDPYLLRWWVIPRNRFFNIYLHNTLKSDQDIILHDHPWWNLTFMLSGHYLEHRIVEGGIHTEKDVVKGMFMLRSAKQAHRLQLPTENPDKPVITLFITGPRIRNWGFHCRKGWVPFQEFTDPTNYGNVGRGCGEME